VGWHNPPISWREFEERLSWRPAEHTPQEAPDEPQAPRRAEGGVPWAELHVHSSFSFLDGASSPDALVAEVRRMLDARGPRDRGRPVNGSSGRRKP
jgi:error-prone DNA polymerase